MKELIPCVCLVFWVVLAIFEAYGFYDYKELCVYIRLMKQITSVDKLQLDTRYWKQDIGSAVLSFDAAGHQRHFLEAAGHTTWHQ